MFVTQVDVDRARGRFRQAPWRTAWERLLELERGLAASLPVRVDRTRHNWLLEQTRLTAKYLHTLVVLHGVEPTTDREAGILALLEDILSWEEWALEGEFDLSTGELAVCLSGFLAWGGETFPASLVARLREALTHRALEPYARSIASPAGWWRSGGSNWSAVCHAGGYFAALALPADERSAAVEAAAWAGLESFVAAQPADGGSTESVSYWQYGLRYLTYALLAWERKHGCAPALCKTPQLAHGARFYLDFVPEGAPIGFGDCSYAPPEALLLKYCELVGDLPGRAALEQLLIRYLQRDSDADKPRFIWNQPREAQALLFCMGETAELTARPTGVAAFPETGWYSVSHDKLTVAFRTGENTEAHAMADQLAVNAAVDGVVLLRYVENHPYTVGWFDKGSESTRQHYFEAQSLSKNTLVVNGIGQIQRGFVHSQSDAGGVTADAAHLYPSFVTRARRTVRLAEDGIELIDEMATDGACWHEIRFFTDGEIEEGEGGSVVIAHLGRKLELRIAASIPVRSLFCVVTPSIGVRPPFRMLRITTETAVTGSTFTTRLLPRLPVKPERVRKERSTSPQTIPT